MNRYRVWVSTVSFGKRLEFIAGTVFGFDEEHASAEAFREFGDIVGFRFCKVELITE